MSDLNGRVNPQTQIHIGADSKIQFVRCFGLKALQIRGESFKGCDFFMFGAKMNGVSVSAAIGGYFFSITKAWSEKLGMNTNFC